MIDLIKCCSKGPEPPDIDIGDCMANLSHQQVLPVARGLIALLLNNAANVDMFLLACKVKHFSFTVFVTIRSIHFFFLITILSMLKILLN